MCYKNYNVVEDNPLGLLMAWYSSVTLQPHLLDNNVSSVKESLIISKGDKNRSFFFIFDCKIIVHSIPSNCEHTKIQDKIPKSECTSVNNRNSPNNRS